MGICIEKEIEYIKFFLEFNNRKFH